MVGSFFGEPLGADGKASGRAKEKGKDIEPRRQGDIMQPIMSREPRGGFRAKACGCFNCKPPALKAASDNGPVIRSAEGERLAP